MATKMTAVQAKLQATTVDFQKMEAGKSPLQLLGKHRLMIRNVRGD